MNFCNISPWKLHHSAAAVPFLKRLNQDNCAIRFCSFENRIEIVHLVPGILSADGQFNWPFVAKTTIFPKIDSN